MSRTTEKKLLEYEKLLYEESANFSLVSRTDRDRLSRQIEDSLAVMECWNTLGVSPDGIRVVDIGSGGGLPAIPLAIMKPECRFCLVESHGKKAAFLKNVSEFLCLGNVHVIEERAERLAHQAGFRESFQYALGKAVAPLPILIEVTIPFLKVGGRCFFHKGFQIQKEITAAEDIMGEMRVTMEKICKYQKGEEPGKTIIVLEKRERTEERFPRSTQYLRRSQKRYNLECFT